MAHALRTAEIRSSDDTPGNTIFSPSARERMPREPEAKRRTTRYPAPQTCGYPQ
jgi:hypothetical protein